MSAAHGEYRATTTTLTDREQRRLRLDPNGYLATTSMDAAGNARPAASATDPAYTQSAPLPAGTDRSGTTSATAGTATLLAAANTARRGLNIQNIGAGNIGINESGGSAVIGSPGTYTIAAAGSFNVRTNRAISVSGANATSPYTATEF